MGQCFTKGVKAVRVYASTDHEEIRDFFAGLISSEHLGCLSVIRNAAEKLEEVANAPEFVDKPIAEILHTPQWVAAIERSVPGTGGQAQPAPFTSAGSASIEIDAALRTKGCFEG